MTILNFLHTIGVNIFAVFADFRFNDFLDICFVTFIIYNAIKIIRETRSATLVKGLLLLGAVYAVVSLLDMETSRYFFNALFRDVLLVLIVVFQPEIRHIFETVGRSRFSSIFGLHARSAELRYNEEITELVEEISRACTAMSERKVGALIVLERETRLGEVIETGTRVDARVSEELLCNVFYPKAPLHDGAAIIRENRLCAAGCILPLTQHHNAVSSALGTRHRAAIGMSEQSDAIVVVVSEETGGISVAKDGRLQRDLSDGDLRDVLSKKLLRTQTDETESKFKSFFGRKQK